MKVKEIIFEDGHVFPTFIMEDGTRKIATTDGKGNYVFHYLDEDIVNSREEARARRAEQEASNSWYKKIFS